MTNDVLATYPNFAGKHAHEAFFQPADLVSAMRRAPAPAGQWASTPIGHTVVCDRAIRDEGLSHHYLPPGKYAPASPGLTSELQEEFTQRGISHLTGTSWTIDALFRETAEEVRHYQAEGVLTVEMEAAALFAIAAHRQVDIASAFVISDSFADLEWNPQFGSPAVHNRLADLYTAAVNVLRTDT